MISKNCADFQIVTVNEFSKHAVDKMLKAMKKYIYT